MAAAPVPERPLERSGAELRERAASRRSEIRDPARAELRRRCGNLHGAVIPEWEKAARGVDPDAWKLW